MTRRGFKSVVVREEAYKLANKQATLEGTSIADIVTRAIQRYINRKLEREDTIRTILRVLEEQEKG